MLFCPSNGISFEGLWAGAHHVQVADRWKLEFYGYTDWVIDRYRLAKEKKRKTCEKRTLDKSLLVLNGEAISIIEGLITTVYEVVSFCIF